MFEHPDTVDWQSLSHSHGSAAETPKHLNTLEFGTLEERRSALNYFWCFFLHQGSRYEASPHLVPFLFEILQRADSGQREIVDLLLGLAVGYGESFLPCGYDLREEQRGWEQNDGVGLFCTQLDRRAYLAVNANAKLFARLLDARFDSECRLSAGFALAHFADSVTDCIGDVSNRLKEEHDACQVGNLLLCLGMLQRHAGARKELDRFMGYLSPLSPMLFRLSAAIALATVCEVHTPELAVDTLLNSLSQGWSLAVPRTDWTWWNQGDLLGYAALVCTLLGAEKQEEIVMALCSALEKVPRSTFALPTALLRVLFPNEKAPQGRDPMDFNPLQKKGVGAWIASGRWTSWMINSHFLPTGLTGDDYRQSLEAFLRAVKPGKSWSSHELLPRESNVSAWESDVGI